MHVEIITEGNQIFECETGFLTGEAKTKVNEYVRDVIDTLDHVFWKNEEPVINSFEDRKNWDEEAKKADNERKQFEELKKMFE